MFPPKKHPGLDASDELHQELSKILLNHRARLAEGHAHAEPGQAEAEAHAPDEYPVGSDEPGLDSSDVHDTSEQPHESEVHKTYAHLTAPSGKGPTPLPVHHSDPLHSTHEPAMHPVAPRHLDINEPKKKFAGMPLRKPGY